MSSTSAVDVAVSGGGLVGASLALALAKLSLKVVLIEAHPLAAPGQSASAQSASAQSASAQSASAQSASAQSASGQSASAQSGSAQSASAQSASAQSGSGQSGSGQSGSGTPGPGQSDSGQPSFDDRSTALSNGSRRIFEALGVWPLIERDATAIRRIHVSDQGRFGFARISAQEQGLDALGFVVTNRVMGAALWRRLGELGVEVMAPARVTAMRLAGDHQQIECATGAGEPMQIDARLAVAADGARSTLRQSAGIGARVWDYAQTALVSNVFSQRFHDHVAYERFTTSGPLALLPMSGGRLGLIWTLPPDTAVEVAKLPDVEFIARLQEAFGFRLGRFTRAGTRQLYPLSLTRSDEHVAARLAIVGNAAQSLHPIAGQGFNLGLRDAASLAEVLADARAAGAAAFDPGDGLLLERYREWRASDRQNILRFTDGLVRLFTQPFGPVKLLRDAGMLAFDLLPAAKDALSQLSLGAAGRVPRLARGGRL